MLDGMYARMAASNPVSVVIIAIAFMLMGGFLLTRLTRLLRLPNVTGYIIAGILMGPYCLDVVPAEVISGMEFVPDLALAFIAFGTGEFFRLDVLKENGAKVTVIALIEVGVVSVLVFAVCFFALRLSLAFSPIFAAIAMVTAPTSTVMTIRQTGAKGDFVNSLLQVIAIDDILGLVAYSVALSVAIAKGASGDAFISLRSVIEPLLMNLGVLVLGCFFGFFMKLLMPKKRSTDNRLIISIALLFAFCGVCAILDVSPLLGCMSMGTVYINLVKEDKLFKQLAYFSPPILLLFFVRSGVSFRLDALFSGGSLGALPLIVVAVVYLLVRMVGKYGGAFFGSLAVGKPAKLRNYLGLGLVPQAGVAIGLAALGARAIGGDEGSALETVIVAAGVLYEIVGPVCAKAALYLSGSYSNNLEELTPTVKVEEGKEENRVEVLIARIQEIQKTLPAHEEGEEERAFTEAAEEQYENAGQFLRRRFTRWNR